ncbi:MULTISPECIES: hypothetical protein [unclassified Cedecea]|uniref:hypothetical protein n=1 Tax=unclassified Cedecea TaxID=2649846 RepID=UPI00301A6DDF
MSKPTYEELEAQVMNLEAALSTATESLANAHHVLRVETARSKELEAQVQGLAAENADLKHPGTYLPSKRETPITDAALAEIRNEARASAIPDGYVLVPQQIFLDASDIESICSQCGDGGPNYGDFSDGLLWVGDIQNDEGISIYGLHISSADYLEEGGITVCEFPQQLRKEQGK